MQIPSSHNLVISQGFQPPAQHAHQQSSRTTQTVQTGQADNSPPSQEQHTLTASSPAYSTFQPRGRLDPLLEQNLGHRGQQAQSTYQEVAMAGEAELVNRLDVLA